MVDVCLSFYDFNYYCFVTGSLKRSLEISPPKTIDDIPEKLLMSGINLPGKDKYLTLPQSLFNNSNVKYVQ